MKAPAILIVDREPTASAAAAMLSRRGHDVAVATSFDEALELGAPCVLVTEIELGSRSGFELHRRLADRGRGKTIFLAGRATVDDCRRALLLGAVEFLTKPFRPDELVRAVERARAAQPQAGPDELCVRETAGTGAPLRLARELVAWAARRGLGPTLRARMASATAELVENVHRHAYVGTGAGTVELRARLDGQDVRVTVADDGIGFDPGATSAHCFDSPLHNGFARAAALAEDVELDSEPGRGARVTLHFSAYRVHFDEPDEGVDLSDLDHLTPEQSRRVLRLLDEDPDAPLHLSPAVAVSLGRLLSGPSAAHRARLALWS